MAAILTLVTAACSHALAPDWTYDYPEYYNDASASTFAPDLVVLISAVSPFNRPIVGLDPATGRLRFEILGTAALRGENGALFIASMAHEPGRYEGHYTLAEVDSRSGSVLRTISLSPRLSEFPPVHMVIAGANLLAMDGNRIAAYRLSDGRLIWSTKADHAVFSSPLLFSDRIVLAGETYSAYRLSDGQALWRWRGTCCALKSSPDGKHFYVADGTKTAILDASGNKVGTLSGGIPRASSIDWIAVADGSGMSVYRHGESEPTLHLATENKDQYFSAIALHEDSLLYFDSANDTVWMRSVRGGRPIAVHRSKEKLVIGPDASGTAPANVNVPPIVTRDHIYVWDWQLHAYPPLDQREWGSMFR